MILKSLIAAMVLSAAPGIEGPKEVEAGTPVVLTIAIEENSAYKWQILSNNATLKTYDICPKDSPASQICILGTTASGVYRIQLIVATIDDATVTPVIELAEHVVKIGEGGPGDPPVEPGPTVIERTVANLAGLTKDKKTAKTLSGLFLIISGQGFDNPESMVAATDAAVTVALRGRGEKWAEFMKALEVVLKKLAADGKMTTVAHHQAVWVQISNGLKMAAE